MRNVWLLLLLVGCGSASSSSPTSPATADPIDGGDERRVERPAPPTLLEDCTTVDDGCEVEAPAGTKALSYFREALWVASDGTLTKIPAGGKATFVRDMQTNVAGDFVVTDKLAFVGTMLGVAPKSVVRGFPLEGGDAIDFGSTQGVAFGDCVVRDGEQVVWTAGSGDKSVLGIVDADGTRPVDVGVVPSPNRQKGMSLVAADGDHVFFAVEDRLLHGETANLASAKEVWKGAVDDRLQAVVRDGDTLFFVVNGTLMKMPKYGGPATRVGEVGGSVEHLRVSEGAVFWRTMQLAEGKKTATWRTMPTSGGASRALLTRESETGAYAVGSGFFFAVARSSRLGRDAIVRVKWSGLGDL